MLITNSDDYIYISRRDAQERKEKARRATNNIIAAFNENRFLLRTDRGPDETADTEMPNRARVTMHVTPGWIVGTWYRTNHASRWSNYYFSGDIIPGFHYWSWVVRVANTVSPMSLYLSSFVCRCKTLRCCRAANICAHPWFTLTKPIGRSVINFWLLARSLQVSN